ncbi:urease accessory protein UreF [Actinobacillus equuli]|nr:urease accessory protein UreF [Actinobacillus equuli]
MVAQAMNLDKAETLYAFYYNAAVGAVTNGVKLVPLSQMDGQDIYLRYAHYLRKRLKIA